ncbi:hypothetical protein HHL10_23410 [Azohydromonas sp. G-1-1-14]|uniref:Uncharacterized protein n=1 Tax=Azohydromonas caseinilytica TaxID=2728836 RepID=A0A848FI32_9BURK|nr:hypothetical protein [Azohydromonas caseinilytica]
MSEAAMQDAEARFPELAAQAGRAAHQRALQRLGKVVKAQDGQLVEARADGTVQVLHALPVATAVQRGMVLKRRSAR